MMQSYESLENDGGGCFGTQRIVDPKNFHFWEEKVLNTMVIFDDVNLSNFVNKSMYKKVLNGNRGRRNVSACTK
jgi:hypothetical protein